MFPIEQRRYANLTPKETKRYKRFRREEERASKTTGISSSDDDDDDDAHQSDGAWETAKDEMRNHAPLSPTAEALVPDLMVGHPYMNEVAYGELESGGCDEFVPNARHGALPEEYAKRGSEPRSPTKLRGAFHEVSCGRGAVVSVWIPFDGDDDYDGRDTEDLVTEAFEEEMQGHLEDVQRQERITGEHCESGETDEDEENDPNDNGTDRQERIAFSDMVHDCLKIAELTDNNFWPADNPSDNDDEPGYSSAEIDCYSPDNGGCDHSSDEEDEDAPPSDMDSPSNMDEGVLPLDMDSQFDVDPYEAGRSCGSPEWMRYEEDETSLD